MATSPRQMRYCTRKFAVKSNGHQSLPKNPATVQTQTTPVAETASPQNRTLALKNPSIFLDFYQMHELAHRATSPAAEDAPA